MYGKKQRIISFLMAFLLIFTFAFINPLTVSQSNAFTPVLLLTPEVAKIIGAVIVSSGLVITAGNALQEVDYESAINNLTATIYYNLDKAQQASLHALSVVVDNIVNISTQLYDAIVNLANRLLRTSDTQLSLVEQGISIKYAEVSSSILGYPELSFPFYDHEGKSFGLGTNNTYTERKIDLREAQPFLVYRGVDNAEENILYDEGIEYFALDVFDDSYTASDYNSSLVSSNVSYISLTPDLSSYSIGDSSNAIYLYQTSKNKLEMRGIPGTWYSTASFNGDINDYIFYIYLLYGKVGSGNSCYSVTDVYDKKTGEFLGQTSYDFGTYGIGYEMYWNRSTTTPLEYDITLVPEVEVTAPVTVEDGQMTVITLPTVTSDIVGLTSADVNVGTTTDTPGTDTGAGENTGINTETMENINTNVGELVTGGTLGEQVNTNIGTVEGLHGEITEQVDFGAVFDTIAQYISSLDISSVTWFPVAVAGFIAPFLPLISLGIILFFIDRVLNGGA